jgi:hypothetical protein
MATGSYREERGNPWAEGLSLFAGIMMVTVAGFMILQGLVAVINDEWYLRAPNYTYDIDLTAWGWLHMLLGVILGVVGAGVIAGNIFARISGMIVVVFVMVDNFLFIPYYPFWSILLIALDGAILWALATAPAKDY